MSKTSDSSGSVVPAEVTGLIEESRTIQGWLDRLANHEGDASPEVFDRVRADYQGRLASVTDSLATHRAELSSSLETRRSEVATLEADRARQAGELEEGTLRHVVGEFSDDEWNELRSSLETAVSDLDELLEMESSAVAELATIVAAIDGDGGLPVGVKPEPAESKEETAGSDSDEGDLTIAEIQASPDEQTAEAEAEEEQGEPEPTEVEAAAEEEPEAVADATEETEESAAEDVEITVETPDEGPAAKAADSDDGDEDYLDELEFLESLSLDESNQFDAVSAMLDDEEGKKDG